MTTFDIRRVTPNCTLHLDVEVFDAPEVQAPNVTLIPFCLDVTFLYDFDLALWAVRARVFGAPILRDGTRGKRSRSVTFHEDNLSEAPQWVRDFVRLHFPPALPALERIGSR